MNFAYFGAYFSFFNSSYPYIYAQANRSKCFFYNLCRNKKPTMISILMAIWIYGHSKNSSTNLTPLGDMKKMFYGSLEHKYRGKKN